MNQATEYLTSIRRINKLHESMLKETCGRYQLTLIEATIISFLYNNPEKDTAADIVELRMLQKGNVSQAVETLCQKALLQREPDQADRRRVHLALTKKAEPIVRSMAEIKARFLEELFAGIPETDLETFHRINHQIQSNARAALKRRELK